jgi:hypothetical protein
VYKTDDKSNVQFDSPFFTPDAMGLLDLVSFLMNQTLQSKEEQGHIRSHGRYKVAIYLLTTTL